MTHKLFWAILLVVAIGTLQGGLAHAQVKVTTEAARPNTSFRFTQIPRPAANDLGSKATMVVAAGRPDNNSGGVAVLNDARLPSSEDQPSANFFFQAGTDGGQIKIDLGRVVSISGVATYSWHPTTRSAQVYKLYVADASVDDPGKNLQSTDAGWRMIADVDSRAIVPGGGQQGTYISHETGAIAESRYLLLKIRPTETDDPFGNTFFSEIDILEANSTPVVAIPETEGKKIDFEAAESQYRFTIDMSDAPDLAAWAEEKLKPVVQTWYPKIVEMLPSDDYTAPEQVIIRFRGEQEMQGIPAYASGATVTVNADWARREINREALGAVVHELVHVVQSYSAGRGRSGRRTRTPGWIVEGIPDYIRWFLYEPETKGAEITRRNLQQARYDASYRVSANFLSWIVETYGRQVIVDLNAVAREGRYTDQFWIKATGATEQELNSRWLEFHRSRLNAD